MVPTPQDRMILKADNKIVVVKCTMSKCSYHIRAVFRKKLGRFVIVPHVDHMGCNSDDVKRAISANKAHFLAPEIRKIITEYDSYNVAIDEPSRVHIQPTD